MRYDKQKPSVSYSADHSTQRSSTSKDEYAEVPTETACNALSHYLACPNVDSKKKVSFFVGQTKKKSQFFKRLNKNSDKNYKHSDKRKPDHKKVNDIATIRPI